MADAFIALGSNVGNRKENLKAALRALSEQNEILKVSSTYETEPMYFEGQDWFLNCVVKIRTELSPISLFRLAKSIEQKMGRDVSKNRIRFGPRLIDIDILFYGKQIISAKELEIPHPRIQERSFVLVPLAEIEPGFIHPALNKSISELLGDLHSEKRVVKI